MTTEMVERVARAICALDGHGPDSPCYSPSGTNHIPWWTQYKDKARAAIAALREPTGGMVVTATYRDDAKDGATINHGVYRAMIDAALGEGRE